MSDQPTLQDVLEAVNTSSSVMQEQFDSMSGRLDSMSGRMDGVATKEDLSLALGKQKYDILDHMDRAFAEFEGSLMTSLRQEDNKVNLVLDI